MKALREERRAETSALPPAIPGNGSFPYLRAGFFRNFPSQALPFGNGQGPGRTLETDLFTDLPGEGEKKKRALLKGTDRS